jgi:hypothetical protein
MKNLSNFNSGKGRLVLRELPPGGLGNRLFTYNFILQLCAELDVDYSFNFIESFPAISLHPKRRNLRDMFASQFNWDKNETAVKDLEGEIKTKLGNSPSLKLRGSFLGETFFEYTRIKPSQLLNFKSNFSQTCDEPVNNLKIAAHFRGGDFKTWNPDAILSPQYYTDAIDSILEDYKGAKFCLKLISDDRNLDSLIRVQKRYSNTPLCLHNKSGGGLEDDFMSMVGSNFLISSPSTFAIWAGIFSDSSIIYHSKIWVEKRSKLNDTFWRELNNGENAFYKARLV